MTKAVILGAGSIGCFHGLSWLSNGLDVSFVGRPATGDALKAEGGAISGTFGERHVAPDRIEYATTPKSLVGADIIFLAVKATGTDKAAADIQAHASAGTVVVSLQNGIGNGDRLKTLLPEFEIVEGMTAFNAVRISSNHWKKTIKGELMVGRHPLLETFFAPLRGSPFEVELRDDMPAVMWSKLLLNLNNALNALSGETVHTQLSNDTWRKILATAQDEALVVMAAEGVAPVKLTPLPPRLLPAFIRLPNWIFNSVGLRMQGIDRQARSSTSDDFAAGRPSEIDYLNGAIVQAGKRYGIPCPVNEAIVRCVKEAEAGGQKRWSAGEVLSKVDEKQ